MRLVTALLLLCTLAVAKAEPLVDCLDCHRPGAGRGEVPLIEGQHEAYLRSQLLRFRDRHRDSFPMSALAAGLNETEAEGLAQALAERPWRSDPRRVAETLALRGAVRAADLDCQACHGSGFLGGGDLPRLAGQHPGYLARQILAFGRGERYHPPTGTGARMYGLDEADAEALGAWLHAVAAPTAN